MANIEINSDMRILQKARLPDGGLIFDHATMFNRAGAINCTRRRNVRSRPNISGGLDNRRAVNPSPSFVPDAWSHLDAHRVKTADSMQTIFHEPTQVTRAEKTIYVTTIQESSLPENYLTQRLAISATRVLQRISVDNSNVQSAC